MKRVCSWLRQWKIKLITARIICLILANIYDPLDIISIALIASMLKDTDQPAIGGPGTMLAFPH